MFAFFRNVTKRKIKNLAWKPWWIETKTRKAFHCLVFQCVYYVLQVMNSSSSAVELSSTQLCAWAVFSGGIDFDTMYCQERWMLPAVTSASLEELKQKKSGHNRKDKLENKSQVANEAGTRAGSEGKY